MARIDPELLRPTWPAMIYVALLGRLDDPSRIPDLVDLLGRLAPSEEEAARERQGPIQSRLGLTDGLRIDIVNALARLTGWDARRAGDGSLRPLDDVVADYRRECGAAVAAATGR
jgi:hypothetical protein